MWPTCPRSCSASRPSPSSAANPAARRHVRGCLRTFATCVSCVRRTPPTQILAPLLAISLVGAQVLLETRVCGSPAVDGYAHVNNTCLLNSPTARWWRAAAAEVGVAGMAARSQVHIERHADYDGLAVRWGIDHKMDSVEACAQACLQHQPVKDSGRGVGGVDGAGMGGAGPMCVSMGVIAFRVRWAQRSYSGSLLRCGSLQSLSKAHHLPLHALTHNTVNIDSLPCNAFAWCSEKDGCFEPDAHKHTYGDCWLKWTEAPAWPEVNMRGSLSEGARERHPNAPVQVQWHAGVVLPRGVWPTNGTWSPRYWW